MSKKIRLIIIQGYFLLFSAFSLQGQELFTMPVSGETRWVSFENRNGEKGSGAMENKGAKGHAFDSIPAGATVDLLNFKGSGTVRRIWMTISDRRPEMLRSLRMEMFWDGNTVPAVSAPLGDFFGIGLGQKVPFENELFADPEGRSFNCFIPMPFHTGARICITNDSETSLYALFYDIDLTLEPHPESILYFHTYWNRNMKTEPGMDFEILPEIQGQGRFLGSNIGVITNPVYKGSWWGEGEVKIYLDGDGEYPTLVGSGTEDYIGTAYGQGAFSHRYQGSPVVNEEKGEYAFYRYHIPDPVWFRSDIRVCIQQIGGAPRATVIQMIRKGAKLIPVSIDNRGLVRLLDMDKPVDLSDPILPDGWTNFYRSDDVSATAYFYLDQPVNNLPRIQDRTERVAGLVDAH